jgi:hypothetical protein
MNTTNAHCVTVVTSQVKVVPEGSELLPGGYTVLMRLPRSYTHAAQSDFVVDLLVILIPPDIYCRWKCTLPDRIVNVGASCATAWTVKAAL